jgi:hypothetical protein
VARFKYQAHADVVISDTPLDINRRPPYYRGLATGSALSSEARQNLFEENKDGNGYDY